MRIGALTSLLLVAAIGAGGPGGKGDFAQRAAVQLEQANAELAAGHAAESLAAAELGLEYAPDSRKLLEAAERAAVAAGRRDDALFWSLELRERRADLDPLLSTSKESRELYDRFESAAAAAAGLERRFTAEHLPANAADVARATRGTRFSTEPPPARHDAREDAKEGFANAREKQSRHFTVRSDVDGTTADEIADAMEAMHHVYRAIFRPRGEVKRVAIKAYRSREEFDAHEPGVQPEVHGFYAPQTRSIALYDPRHEGAGRAGRPFTAFWATLMHEAAHPYLHELGGKEPLPAWLNEGSACFFEGWRYVRGGRVESGDVPRSRLRELIEILDTGRPDLKSVLQWHEGGSLPASHYPVGWALVEFSFHFEDEAGDRPYFDAYRDLLDSWRNGDDRRDGFARLVDCYVDRRKRAGVATFADFEQLWSRWMRGLAARTFGGPEQADAWLALALRQTEQRRFNAAAESLRSALDHRPGDPELLVELAGCALERNDRDGALLAARRALASAAGASRESALALLTRADRRLSEEIVASDDRLREATLATAKGYAQAGLPRCALRRIDEATPLLLDDAELQPLRAELRKAGVEPGRWRRLAPDAEAAGRDAIEPAATRYVVEALIEPGAPGNEVAGDASGGASDRSVAAGDAYGAIVFGESERDGARLFGVSERRRLALLSARSTWEGTEEFTTAAAAGPVRLTVEVDLAHDGRRGLVTCRLDGKEVRSDPLDVADFLPRAGVVAVGASIRITDARWRQ